MCQMNYKQKVIAYVIAYTPHSQILSLERPNNQHFCHLHMDILENFIEIFLDCLMAKLTLCYGVLI
jgi:hypothetical protein